MKRVVFALLVLSFSVTAKSNVVAQAQQTTAAPAAASQNRVVGVVTAIDKATGQLTVKTDTGESITVVTNDKSAVLRLPPGETSAQNAAKITLADVAVGDRLFARGTNAADGKSIDARQVVVTGGAVAAAGVTDQQRQREDFRQRGLMGRITALDSGKKEVTVQSRSREGVVPVTVAVTDSTKVFRYAPDSMNIKDATRASFSDLKVGDQLRALGEKTADGTRLSAEEIIAGSTTRTGGQVVAVNPAKNEITIKNVQGQNITVVVGQRSSLRRVTPELAAAFEANRPQRQGAPGAGAPGDRPARSEGQERRRERREGAPGAAGDERRSRGGGGGGGGRGFQDLIEKAPAITVADLKKGDMVFVSGSEGADPSRVTAIMLVTGDPTFMSRFIQTGPNRGPQSPGLPGDVIGGGVGPAERPTSPR
ncbi:MAG TPA: DUF5666 domain-containing protein [Pyrinomonadaceae bacterium]|nr:DUF5666 domain-containing protein [Pyrinomonadaceae bacterium]